MHIDLCRSDVGNPEHWGAIDARNGRIGNVLN